MFSESIRKLGALSQADWKKNSTCSLFSKVILYSSSENNSVIGEFVIVVHRLCKMRGLLLICMVSFVVGSSPSRFVDVELFHENLAYHGTHEHKRCGALNIKATKDILPSAKYFSKGKLKCPFGPSLATCYDMKGELIVDGCLTDKWFCGIDKGDLCDGHSFCLMDECKCGWDGNDVQIFHCSDGFGCVTINLVCDGIYDCLDRSDEMMCDGLADFSCTQWIPSDDELPIVHKLSKFVLCNDHYEQGIMGETKKCKRFPACDGFYYSIASLQTKLQTQDCVQLIMENSASFMVNPYAVNVTEICLTLCKDLLSAALCQRLIPVDRGVPAIAFACPRKTEALDMIHESAVCDGTIDCADSADEMDCEGRFYCDTNSSGRIVWVPESAKCNGFKDCANGLDECSNCSAGMFSSNEYIIRNHGVFVWLIISCGMNLVLNSRTAYKEIRPDWKKMPRHLKVDRILKLQLCLYDSLLGFYLLALVIANLRYHGNYCIHDYIWRSSWACKCLGVLYNASSHGSLLTVFLMSLTRAHKCFFTYSTGMSIRAIINLSAILAVLNLANSTIPIIPTDGIQNIFRVKFSLSQSNPFIKEDLHSTAHVHRLYSQYFGNKSSDLDLYQEIDALKAITNQPSYFDFSELSYYSWSTVCVNDIFGYKESLGVFKVVYIPCVCSILLGITVFYMIILQVSIRSRKVLNQASEDDKEFHLKVKVILMIGTKLLPWLTIIGAIIYYNYTRKNVPEEWYQITAICIIPANSLLNPMFNSAVIENLSKLIRRCLSPPTPDQEKEESTELKVVNASASPCNIGKM